MLRSLIPTYLIMYVILNKFKFLHKVLNKTTLKLFSSVDFIINLTLLCGVYDNDALSFPYRKIFQGVVIVVSGWSVAICV